MIAGIRDAGCLIFGEIASELVGRVTLVPGTSVGCVEKLEFAKPFGKVKS